ncbi:hypothetical protein B0A52_00953 [Exophiala mesophila]|uniref:Uncharacterized protein n=1 Tax=Exophiala mesophila TaxID=212818 RepID=A0A438NIS1_EXOME|nr:hypothetical protein B0A52_00953 [Exophiala mesophila]
MSRNEIVLRKAGKGKRVVAESSRKTRSDPSSPDTDESTERTKSTSNPTTLTALTLRAKSPSNVDSSSTTTSSSPAAAHTSTGNQLQWIPYKVGTSRDDRESREQTPASNSSDEPESRMTTIASAFEVTPYLIPVQIQPNGCDAAVGFFFRHYVGRKTGAPSRLGFNQTWQPSYHNSTEDSPLRLATAAVSVNISMMWSYQGCDTQLPRSLFLQAIAATRHAVVDPVESLSDELLMTILVFDLYDDLLLHYGSGTYSHGAHKRGALALINHRGSVNYQTLQASSLLDTVRNSLLNHYLTRRLSFSPAEVHILERAETSSAPAGSLDMVSLPLVQAQGDLWTFREKRYRRTTLQRREFYEQTIAKAVHVLKVFESWSAHSARSGLRELHVPRQSVLPSIVSAGLYGDHCSVWDNLLLANLSNTFAVRSICTLQLIRQALADEPTLLLESKYRTLLTETDIKIQEFADKVVSSVPFHLGDTVVLTNPLDCDRINYPFSFKIDPETGLNEKLPSLMSDHASMAAATSGWFIYPKLVALYRLAEPEDDAAPFFLREGQLDWIKGQIVRLQRIFLFTDPPWFKRQPKASRGKVRGVTS